MLGKKKNKEQVEDTWLSDAVELPRGDSFDTQKIMKKERFWRRYAWTAFYMFPISALLLALFIANAIGGVKASRSMTQQVTSTSAGRAAAQQAVASWLVQTPSPVDGGRIVSWDGATPIDPILPKDDQERQSYLRKIEEQGGQPAQTEINKFTIADKYNLLYTSEVQVMLDKRGGAKAVSTPSLVPVPQTVNDDWFGGNPWIGSKPGQITDSLDTAVKTWAEAYVGNDADKLRLTVGDQDANHGYAPMYGAQLVKVTPVAVGIKEDEPGVLIARVNMNIVWPGQTKPEIVDDSKNPPIQYDLRIERADTAAPIVTAWGGAGTGYSLTAYQNAVNTPRPAPEVEKFNLKNGKEATD